MNLINTLRKRKTKKLPIWIMRQAGRYLPEFRKQKKKSKGFINMIYDPKIASDITLQPIKRFGFDAAIIFSDILTIPDSLGQDLTYQEGKGPILKEMSLDQMIANFSINKNNKKLLLVYEAIRKTKRKIKKDISLIGFVGAPLTVSLFMFDNRKERKYSKTLAFFKRNIKKTRQLFKLLEDATAKHAIRQADAGAQVIQIFDTWANIAGGRDLETFSIGPIKRISSLIKKEKPNVPIIVFPRNVGTKYEEYIYKHIDCISVGEDIREKEIKKIQQKKTIQGNLSPKALLDGGKKLENEIKKVLDRFSGKPFIFNLSHGIMPETPIKNVKRLVEVIRNYKNEV